MPDGSTALHLTLIPSIREVSRGEWDACAGGGNPFLSHDFLSALEESHSAVAESGWGPRHVLARDDSGRLVGAVPLYVKGHSFGEYVFDWAWAEAYERAGGEYYPKLLAGVPFTPVTGPRLLVHPDAPTEAVQNALARGLGEAARQLGVSSLHVNFCLKDEWDVLGASGFLQREGQQYHWYNHSYKSFDDFLASLSSRKRKNIRKEREAVRDSGLRIETLNGAAIEERHWDAFYRFYEDTAGRKWGQAYLTRAFFDMLGERLADRVVLVMAFNGTKPIAGALNLMGEDALYGRNWGAIEHHPFLHFEVCYYRAIDFAIECELARVEAGAGGRHKIARGYLPAATYSAHWIGEPRFRNAVARFLKSERSQVAHEREALAERGPFRKAGDAPVATGDIAASAREEDDF
ncbi:MAG TPA: GNAT family N-acetyltransferase [Alphaproteobacteria bacterium]|jgi:predicted N-acyltransferase|nr:GNAT family N-acetyltransferase [Alphaproteobacteria bacterium]